MNKYTFDDFFDTTLQSGDEKNAAGESPSGRRMIKVEDLTYNGPP